MASEPSIGIGEPWDDGDHLQLWRSAKRIRKRSRDHR